MSEPEDQRNSAWRKLLGDTSQERRAQGRHSENLRSNVSNYVLVAASGIVAVITFDRVINRYDLVLALLLIAIGLLGTLFCASYTERYHRNRQRASKLLKELDRISDASGERKLGKIEDDADSIHFQYDLFRLVYKFTSSHWLWLVFPLLVVMVGIVLTALALHGWSSEPSH